MPSKSDAFFPWIVVAAVFFGGQYIEKNGMPSLGPVAVVGEVPSTEMQGIVSPIKAVAVGKPLAPKLGHWYRDAASVIRTDTRITSTEQARQWLIDVDAIAISGTDVVGAVPGFGAAKNKAVTDAMGLENVPLDADKRKRLADVLDAIGWALGG